MTSARNAAPAQPATVMADLLPCRQRRGDLWFSDLPDELDQANAYWRQCPLRTACLAGAIERAESCGVWGGEIFCHGVIVARKRPRGRPPKSSAF